MQNGKRRPHAQCGGGGGDCSSSDENGTEMRLHFRGVLFFYFLAFFLASPGRGKRWWRGMKRRAWMEGGAVVGGERARAFGYGVRARVALSFLSVHLFRFIHSFSRRVVVGRERKREKEEERDNAAVGVGRERRLILTTV